MSDSRIQTTVAGRYPIPAWLAVAPPTPNRRDALLAVLKTQEMAGTDALEALLLRFVAPPKP